MSFAYLSFLELKTKELKSRSDVVVEIQVFVVGVCVMEIVDTSSKSPIVDFI